MTRGYEISSLAVTSCHGLISNHQGVLTCPTPAPTIAVQSRGDGAFLVTGSGFLPSAVVTPDGRVLGLPTGKICQRPGELFFSANDGWVEAGSAIVSNTVTTSCPF